MTFVRFKLIAHKTQKLANLARVTSFASNYFTKTRQLWGKLAYIITFY